MHPNLQVHVSRYTADLCILRKGDIFMPSLVEESPIYPGVIYFEFLTTNEEGQPKTYRVPMYKNEETKYFEEIQTSCIVNLK